MATTSAVFAHRGEQKRLLRVDDVCERLQVGKTKVFEFIASGELESLKVGGARRFTEEQLADFIAKRIAASAAEPVSASAGEPVSA